MTKQCPHCKASIPASAKKCSQCGSDLRAWPRRHPILTTLGVIVGIFIFLSILGNATSNKQQTNTSTNQQTQQPLVVDAQTLVGEFDKNKLAANDKYNGKIVQTTAFIENISRGHLKTNHFDVY